MIRFEKVSCAQFKRDLAVHFPGDAHQAEACYHRLPLPRRKTAGAAGYDFSIPLAVSLEPGESVCIPTGIRALMPPDVVLILAPRSGLGVRYRLQLANTLGIIDSDYAQAENEGHILVTLTNDSREGKTLTLQAMEGFVQGIFLPFLRTHEDDATELRTGGFGSTDQ